MDNRMPTLVGLLGLWLGAGDVRAEDRRFGPADPVAKDPAQFDPRRPVARELDMEVPDGFAVSAAGDLIISRPLSPYAKRLEAFGSLVGILQRSDVAYGNLETTIFDPRSFKGSPYSWNGDWTVSALPAVAGDLRQMGFGLVSRANNHALDWGIEGMQETGRWLDQAGIVHAGAGDTHGAARAPQYLEAPRARVALVSLASTFRPTSESLPASGLAPGRPGVSGLRLAEVLQLPPAALRALQAARCAVQPQHCDEAGTTGELFGQKFRQGEDASRTFSMDPVDLAEILRAVRTAQQHADFVIVAIHSHECSRNCEGGDTPAGAADFLRQLAHDAIDSGADMFIATGNHNLGAIEVYDSPARGKRPVFYGLGNFFWSDIQEPLPADLRRGNEATLAAAWENPAKATDYDLTAPLNKQAFATPFTFQSVLAESRFANGELAVIVLHPVEEGYGSSLTTSGIPRLVTDTTEARGIIGQVVLQNERYGVPALDIRYSGSTATVRP